jgi:predicted metal-dependent phosphoesterase TrpH
VRLDLQVHSAVGSGDSVIQPQEFAEACSTAGLEGVGLTEHSSTRYGELHSSLENAGFVLVPGREVAFGPHHILVFSSDEELLWRLPKRPDAQALADSRLACIWAHPAFPGGAGVYPPMVPDYRELSEFVHAVELLNGRRMHVADGITAAAEAARSLGLPLTSGSDAHTPKEIGKCFTEVNVETEGGTADIVTAIRDGRVEPHLSAPWAAVHGYDYRRELAEFVK